MCLQKEGAEVNFMIQYRVQNVDQPLSSHVGLNAQRVNKRFLWCVLVHSVDLVCVLLRHLSSPVGTALNKREEFDCDKCGAKATQASKCLL